MYEKSAKGVVIGVIGLLMVLLFLLCKQAYPQISLGYGVSSTNSKLLHVEFTPTSYGIYITKNMYNTNAKSFIPNKAQGRPQAIYYGGLMFGIIKQISSFSKIQITLGSGILKQYNCYYANDSMVEIKHVLALEFSAGKELLQTKHFSLNISTGVNTQTLIFGIISMNFKILKI